MHWICGGMALHNKHFVAFWRSLDEGLHNAFYVFGRDRIDLTT